MNLITQCEFDLIGQDVIVSDSKNNEIIGIKGKIIMETKNMIIMNTKDGKRSIPKNICQLSNNGEVIQTDSTKLNKRPYERLEILVWHEILELM